MGGFFAGFDINFCINQTDWGVLKDFYRNIGEFQHFLLEIEAVLAEEPILGTNLVYLDTQLVVQSTLPRTPH